MKSQAHRVMPFRIGTEDLPIQRMRQPCQRVPIAGFCARESPSNGARLQTGLDVNVCCYILRIVIIDEIISKNRPESCQSQEEQTEIDKRFTAHFRLLRYSPFKCKTVRDCIQSLNVLDNEAGSFLLCASAHLR